MSTTDRKPMTPEAAVTPVAGAPDADLRAWQDEKVRRGLKAADEGRFATPDQLRKVVRKYVPNG